MPELVSRLPDVGEGLTETAISPAVAGPDAPAAVPEAEKISVLVGYGPSAEGGGRRRRARAEVKPAQGAAPMVHAPPGVALPGAESAAPLGPQITGFLTVDVTETLTLGELLRSRPEFAGLSVTPLVVVAKALTTAIAQNPEINVGWDATAGEIVQFRDVTLGIAAPTPRGLMVPKIFAAQRMSLLELSRALTDLISAARDGTTSPAQPAGGAITITDIGSFGVDAGTPILNPGDAAVLCMGAVRTMPWAVDNELVVRSVMTLSWAVDHRLVDGDLGSRVLARVGAILRDPLCELVIQ